MIYSRSSATGKKILCATRRLALLAISIAAVALVQSCGKGHQSFYPSLADARKAGEIDRGWIPDYFPQSSHSIHILHDPESPRTWCAFEFSPADFYALQRNLTHIDRLPARVRDLDDPNEPWWPDFLVGNLNLAEIHRRGFSVYVVIEQETESSTSPLLFVIDSVNGRGFFYRPPG